MGRKARKQARKNKQANRSSSDKKINDLAWELSKQITKTFNQRDKSKDGKIVKKNRRKGCYNECGKIVFCSNCFYKKACTKWRDGIAEYIRRKK